jgi:two-component system, cell cycle sensor histidine kinase and response regulator CckA
VPFGHPPRAEEPARLAALERYDILDSEPEQSFDDLARLAALVCDAPIAQINFISATRQWSKASFGAPRGDLPREESLCASAIGRPEPLVIENVAADKRLLKFEREIGGARISFYAAVPLASADGHAIGTLCVLDHHPRQLSTK